MDRCKAPTISDDGEIGQCEHAAFAEGRYCTCCEFMAGTITAHDATLQLGLPHVHGELNGEKGFLILPNGFKHVVDGLIKKKAEEN